VIRETRHATLPRGERPAPGLPVVSLAHHWLIVIWSAKTDRVVAATGLRPVAGVQWAISDGRPAGDPDGR
jgi:hypothetical protein